VPLIRFFGTEKNTAALATRVLPWRQIRRRRASRFKTASDQGRPGKGSSCPAATFDRLFVERSDLPSTSAAEQAVGTPKVSSFE